MVYATATTSDLVHDKLNGKIGAGNQNVDYEDAAVNTFGLVKSGFIETTAPNRCALIPKDGISEIPFRLI